MAGLKARRFSAYFYLGMTFLMSIFIFTSAPRLTRVLFSYSFMGVAVYWGYLFSDFKELMTPISFKNLFNLKEGGAGKSIVVGGSAVIGFIILTGVIPGLNIGLPVLPSAISDSLRKIIILVFAPVYEEAFFRVLLMAYLLKTSIGKKNPALAIVIQATLFSVAHLAAYVTGIYDYPTFTLGFSAVSANLSSFLVAWSFGVMAGVIVANKGKLAVKNVLATIILHFGLNAIALGIFSIVT